MFTHESESARSL